MQLSKNAMLKFAVGALALGLFVAAPVSFTSAADAPATQPANATGTVTIKVVDGQGNAVSGAKVMLVAPKTKEKKGDNADGGKQKKDKQKPVASGTTDENGTVVLKDVPMGEYEAMTRVKGQGTGHVKVSVTDTASDATITLGQGKKKGN